MFCGSQRNVYCLFENSLNIYFNMKINFKAKFNLDIYL